MGQKINPTGLRPPVTKNWASRWFATGPEFPRMLSEDLKVREFLRAPMVELPPDCAAAAVAEARSWCARFE